MTEDRITAIVVEAQLRADRRGEAQRVYQRFGCLCIVPASKEPDGPAVLIAIVHPATAHAEPDAPIQAEPPAGLLL